MRRFIDLALCFVFILPLSLFILILAIIIIFVDKFPPIFLQERVGKEGKLFICYKLQTMRPIKNIELNIDNKHNGERVTKLGSFLRNHGWDELPQIWNVFCGDMSLVGPRPLCSKTILRIKEENNSEIIKKWEKRIKLRPGISGWHQIHIFKKNLKYEVRYDVEYCHSWRETIEIISKTLNFFMFGGHEQK